MKYQGHIRNEADLKRITNNLKELGYVTLIKGNEVHYFAEKFEIRKEVNTRTELVRYTITLQIPKLEGCKTLDMFPDDLASEVLQDLVMSHLPLKPRGRLEKK